MSPEDRAGKPGRQSWGRTLAARAAREGVAGLKPSQLILAAALAGFLPGAARAGDLGPTSEAPGLDLGVEHLARRTPDGAWDLALNASALVPVVDLSSRMRLGLRLTDAGQVQRLFASSAIGLSGPGTLDALQWSGRLDRGATGRFTVSYLGALRLDLLRERWGLTHAPWVELGLQTTGGGETLPGQPRFAASVVLAVQLDVGGELALHKAHAPGFRIRASAALGNDPGCNLATPRLLFSGRCLTLALAVDF